MYMSLNSDETIKQYLSLKGYNSFREYLREARKGQSFLVLEVNFEEDSWAKDIDEIGSLDFDEVNLVVGLKNTDPEAYTEMCKAIKDLMDKGFYSIRLTLEDGPDFYSLDWGCIRSFFLGFISKLSIPKTVCELRFTWDQIDERLDLFNSNEEQEVRQIVSSWNFKKIGQDWLQTAADEYFDEV